MKKKSLIVFVLLAVVTGLPAYCPAASVEFELLKHSSNTGLLPQPKGLVGVSGDHLVQTADDITGGTFNPSGCFSFNFMNQAGISEPDYPPGYAEGIHSMTGTLTLGLELQAGGVVDIESIAFDGYVAPSKFSSQWLNGGPFTGTYSASAASNWAFEVSINWNYDTPFAGAGAADITFEDYLWSGFIIPVSELTTAGLAATILDDPLGYFGGTSTDFEDWLLNEVAPTLPQEAAYLLFAQAEDHPDWVNPMMGMTTEGVVGETIVAYSIPEPTTMILLAAGLFCARGLVGFRKGTGT